MTGETNHHNTQHARLANLKPQPNNSHYISIWPGIAASPMQVVSVTSHTTTEQHKQGVLTLIAANILARSLLLRARNGIGITLPLQRRAPIAGTLAIHGPLQGISLPAKQIIAVDAIASVVAVAPVERLGPIGGPLGLVVELARVVHDLVHDLRDLDGVAGGAGAAALKGAAGRVGDVAPVVGAVNVLAVPAGGEGHGHAPAAAAGALGESLGVGPRAGRAAEGLLLHVVLAAEAELLGDFVGVAVLGVADEHAEALVRVGVS